MCAVRVVIRPRVPAPYTARVIGVILQLVIIVIRSYRVWVCRCINLSAVFISASGVFMTPLMITISAQWFPKNERNMATGQNNESCYY